METKNNTIRETPIWLVEKMIGHIDLNIDNRLNILEPSAGLGKIVDGLLISFLKIDNLHLVELNNEKCNVLKEQYKFNSSIKVYHSDFLLWKSDIKYNLIIGAPPFKGNCDLIHIQKMYDLLDDDGMIISLNSPYWILNNEPHQNEFKEWLKNKPHTMEYLPENTFVERGKNVPTLLMIIKK